MVALSDRKIEIVRTLVEAAPDKIVGGLQRALAETSGDTVLASVRQLVEAEARDRMLRNAIFLPVVPLCVGDGSDTHSLVFPARALACVWRGLKEVAAAEVASAETAVAAVAAAVANEQRPPDPSQSFDVLVRVAGLAMRDGVARDFRTAAEICDRARPGGGEAFACCLDICPVVRRAISHLPEWLAETGDETTPAMRLAYKDAVAIAEDAGPRFFEMLAGQLTPPWLILRIISQIMDKPTERYLADSELGGFPERVMKDIDEAVAAIARLDLDGGAKAAAEAAARVGLITQQIFELEVCIELSKDHGWGKRIVEQKRSLANVVESRLKEAEKLAAAALPSEQAGLVRLRKKAPKLDMPPDTKIVGRAMTLLHFSAEIRSYADHGGFSAARTKLVERVSAMLDHYVEDVVDLARTGDVPDQGVAHAFLMVAADFSRLVRDAKAAELVRRRAVICHGDGAA